MRFLFIFDQVIIDKQKKHDIIHFAKIWQHFS